MKYIAMTLLLSVLFLSSCFEKPWQEITESNTGLVDENIEPTNTETEVSTEDDVDGEDTLDSEENATQWDESENISDDSTSENSWEEVGSWSDAASGSEEDILEYEEDLEALFDDILGDNAQ